MKAIKITDPVVVTLKAAQWYWLLGLINAAVSDGDNATLDQLYAQVLEATE